MGRNPKPPHPCEGCIHLRGRRNADATCYYLFDTGHRRPCPPGAECTVKKPVSHRTKQVRYLYGHSGKGGPNDE